MAKVAQLHNNIDRTRNYILTRENIIGRAADCDIYFDNKRVSRRHARVACLPRSDAYFVEDISTRGVYVNFRRVRGRHPLREGDRICILQFRNIHPLELERMGEQELKECTDDPRNDGIKAIVDLTFGYVEVEDKPAEEEDKPEGLLDRIKGLFSRKKPEEAEQPEKSQQPEKPEKPEQPHKAQRPQAPKKKEKDSKFKSSRPGRYEL